MTFDATKPIKLINGWATWRIFQGRYILADKAGYTVADLTSDWADVWPSYDVTAPGDPWSMRAPKAREPESLDEAYTFVMSELLCAGALDLMWYVTQESE